MEWAIPPNLQYTHGVSQIPTKRKQLTTAGPWDIPRPQSKFIRNPMRSFYTEGFQSSSMDAEINPSLNYFLETYARAQTVLKPKDMPKEATDLLTYYAANIDNVNRILTNTANMENDSAWDTEYKYYRFIFSDPNKCTTGTQTKIPDFVFEFHSMGRSIVATNSSTPINDNTIETVEPQSQIYSNGVLLIRLKTRQSFSGVKWGTGNTGANKTPPIMTNWLLQASNNDSVWQDLNIADVFNELIQKDTTRLTQLDDSTKNGYPTTNQIRIYSKTALNRQINQALRAILGTAIDRFRTTYIELPASIQSNLSFIFAQNDRDRSDAYNKETSQSRLQELINLYLNVPIPPGSGIVAGPSTSTYQDQMIREIRQNLLNTIEKTQALAKKCAGPSGAPTASLVSDATIANDLDTIRAPTAASTVSLDRYIDMYITYTNMAKQLTNTVDSQSRLAQLNPVNQDLKVIFKIPDGISTTSFADQTFNGYRIFLNNKLKHFYDAFMYTTVSIMNTSLYAGPPSAQQTIRIPVPYREFYDASIADLYTTDRSTGVSKGKQHYDSIWSPLTAGETPADRINKLRELEALYDSYADTLIRSQAFAKQRFQTINMIEYFEECYRKVIAKIPGVIGDMQNNITNTEIGKDKEDASKMEDKDQLATLFIKYNNLMYSNSGISGNTTERNDLWYCIARRVKDQYATFWINYTVEISYVDPMDGNTYRGYSRDFKRYIRNQDDTKYVLASKPLYIELEDAWSTGQDKLIKNNNYKPSIVKNNLGEPSRLAPSGAPSGRPSTVEYSSLFGTRNAPDNSESWDQKAKKAIEVLQSQKDIGTRIIKDSVFAIQSEIDTYNTAKDSLDIVLSLYENLYNANDLLIPVSADQSGRGFIQRVKDCIDLDRQRPKVVALIENYSTIYDSITNINYDPVLTNQFINKVYNYDISGYVVNEINVMRSLGILDEYDLSGVGQLTTDFREIPTASFNSSSKPGFSLHNLRITGASMNGLWTGGQIGSLGTRISRYDISGNKVEFILSTDGAEYSTMVKVVIKYEGDKLFVKAEEARAEYTSISTTNMPVQKDLITLWNESLTKDGGYEKNRKNQNAPPIQIATSATAEGYGIANLKIGYRNFYNKHSDDLTLLKSYNILSRTSVFGGNTGTPSSATTGIITELGAIQERYYTASGGTGSGYFANLLKYIDGISRDYITKLQKITTEFNPRFTELFTTNWDKISTEDKTKFNTIRVLNGTQILNGNFGDFFSGYSFQGGPTEPLDKGISSTNNTQRINIFSKTVENTETNYGYIHEIMIKTVFNHYISNTDSRYKKALLAITTYTFWKPTIHSLIRTAKSSYDTKYNEYYRPGFENVMNDSLNTYKPTTADTIINGIDALSGILRSTASSLWALYNAKLTADSNKQTLTDQYDEWFSKKNAADTAKTAYNSNYKSIANNSSILPQYLIDWFNNESTTFSYPNNSYTTPDTNKTTSETNSASLNRIKEFISNYQPVPQRFQDAYNALYDRVAVDMNRYYLVIYNPVVNFILPDTGTGNALDKVRSVYPLAEIMTEADMQKLRYINKSRCLCGLYYNTSRSLIRGYASIDAWKDCGGCGNANNAIVRCNDDYGGIYFKLTTSETDTIKIASTIETAINVSGSKVYFVYSDSSGTNNCPDGNSANGVYVEPSANLIKDIPDFYKEFRTRTYSYDFKTGVNDTSTLTAKINNLNTTISEDITACVGKINELYSLTISKYTAFSSSLFTYLNDIRVQKWFVLSDNNGIDEMTTPLKNHYTNIKTWINAFSRPAQSTAITINTFTYNGTISGSFSYTTTGTTTVRFNEVWKVSFLFDGPLLNFYNWYNMMYDFEFALQNEYFKKRRIRLKSDNDLNVSDIIRARDGMSVELHTTLTDYYTTLDYLLVGGGGGGGGALYEHSLLRYSWWISREIFGAVYSGGGGGSGHMKRSTTLDMFGLSRTSFGSQSDVYDSYTNGKTALSQLNIDSKTVKINIGSGGTGNKTYWWNWADVPNLSGSNGGDTGILISDSIIVNVSGGTGGNGSGGGGGNGANNGGNGTGYYYDTTGNPVKREPSNGEGNYGGTAGITTIGEWVFGWGGGGGGGIGSGNGGTGDGNATSSDKSGTAFTGAGGGGGGESGVGKGANGYNSGNAGDGGHGYAILYLTRSNDCDKIFKVSLLDNYRDTTIPIESSCSSSPPPPPDTTPGKPARPVVEAALPPPLIGFQNQTPYNKPLVERKLLVNSLNTIDFTGEPVVSYTFDSFLQSLKSWFT